jgi:hypothetical protein
MAPRKAGTPRPKKTVEQKVVEALAVAAPATVGTGGGSPTSAVSPTIDDTVVTTAVELSNTIRTVIDDLQRPKPESFRDPTYGIKANPADAWNFLGFKVVVDPSIEPGTIRVVGPNDRSTVVKWV